MWQYTIYVASILYFDAEYIRRMIRRKNKQFGCVRWKIFAQSSKLNFMSFWSKKNFLFRMARKWFEFFVQLNLKFKEKLILCHFFVWYTILFSLLVLWDTWFFSISSMIFLSHKNMRHKFLLNLLSLGNVTWAYVTPHVFNPLMWDIKDFVRYMNDVKLLFCTFRTKKS